MSLARKALLWVAAAAEVFGGFAAGLFLLAVYLQSLSIAYKAHGIPAAAATLLLPPLSQLYWFVARWYAHGPADPYCQTVWGFLIASAVAIAGAVVQLAVDPKAKKRVYLHHLSEERLRQFGLEAFRDEPGPLIDALLYRLSEKQPQVDAPNAKFLRGDYHVGELQQECNSCGWWQVGHVAQLATCPKCGSKTSRRVAIEFGGAKVVFDGTRFLLFGDNGRVTLDEADYPDAIQFMVDQGRDWRRDGAQRSLRVRAGTGGLDSVKTRFPHRL